MVAAQQPLITIRRGVTARGGSNSSSSRGSSLMSLNSFCHFKIILLGSLILFTGTYIVLDDTTSSTSLLLTSTLQEYQQTIYNNNNNNGNDLDENSIIRVGEGGEKKDAEPFPKHRRHHQQQRPPPQTWEGLTQHFSDAHHQQQQQQHRRKITAIIPNNGDEQNDESINNHTVEVKAITSAASAEVVESTESVTDQQIDHQQQVRQQQQREQQQRERVELRVKERRIRHQQQRMANRHSVTIQDGHVRTKTGPHLKVHRGGGSSKMPDGFITRHESVAGDPLRDSNWNASNARPLPFSPKTEYLGVLVDAGRHYFPIPWLYNLIDRLADMKYNLIHLRLTDDQAWNVLLENNPDLASPSHVDNPDLRVYTVPELRALVAYGKEHGIAFMPEINVPGHGGAWAAALNGTAIVACPEFICEKGYGVPINVTNPAIFPLLESIIREIIDIFDDPPFLHLGGDEVDMARPCFQEVGQEMPNFQAFEDELRNVVVHKIGYPEERIVRWEMTGQDSLRRVGDMEQFWFSVPGEPRSKYQAGSRFLLSTHMYFDTNGEQDCSEVYRKAERGFHLPQNASVPTAIVAATFELSPTFWFDRNVLGRLLSVAMGAAQIHVQENITDAAGYQEMQAGLNAKYEEYCNILGLGPKICQTQGRPVISTTKYQTKWQRGWDVWKKAICHRLTNAIDTRVFRTTEYQTMQARTATLDYFAANFASVPAANVNDRAILADGLMPQPRTSLGRHDQDKVPEFAGVIFDLTTTMPTVVELKVILEEFVAKLGLNTAQLRFAGKYGWTFENSIKQVVDYGYQNMYRAKDLRELGSKATKLGLQVIPEISVSSNANGYHPTGLLANCPSRFCQEGVPLDISNNIVPITVFSQVATLRKLFPTSRFLHLGSDERQASLPCLEEAAATPTSRSSPAISLSDFDAYEHKLSKMLQLGGDIEPGHVLRWDNAEHIRYPQRMGNITQYRSGTEMSRIRMNQEPFFVTVHLLEKNADGSIVSAWDIYEQARALVNIKPMGIMAEIGNGSFEGWESWEIPQRILAFSMAVSELPVLENESSFTNVFIQICQATLNLESCTPPTARGSELFNNTEDELLLAATQCGAATVIRKRRVMKLGIPHYNNTGKQLLLDQPSKAIWSLS